MRARPEALAVGAAVPRVGRLARVGCSAATVGRRAAWPLALALAAEALFVAESIECLFERYAAGPLPEAPRGRLELGDGRRLRSGRRLETDWRGRSTAGLASNTGPP